MKKETDGIAVLSFISLFVAIFLIIGWIMNIFDLLGASFDPLTGEVVVRLIGIFVFPLGGILGWF